MAAGDRAVAQRDVASSATSDQKLLGWPGPVEREDERRGVRARMAHDASQCCAHCGRNGGESRTWPVIAKRQVADHAVRLD
jgi:hypothetical protein